MGRRPAPVLLTMLAIAALVGGIAGPAQAVGTTVGGTVSRTGSSDRSNLRVSLMVDNGSGFIDAAAPAQLTTATGAYSFTGVAPGTYDLRFEDATSPAIYATEFFGGFTELDQSSGFVVATSPLTFADNPLALGGSITGHVVEGATKTPAGNAVVFVNRRLSSAGTTVSSTQYAMPTDASGDFTLTNLPAGNYRVLTSASGYYSEYWNDWAPGAGAFDSYAVPSGGVGAVADIWLSSAHPASLSYFQDVPSSNPFSTEITWMGTNRISQGTPIDAERPAYEPATAVSRQAMAAFLFRSTLQNFVAPATPTFADVPTTSAFYTPIEWMYAAGITTGTPQGAGLKPLYKPAEPVSRQAMSLFLFRLHNAPFHAPSSPTFADVPSSSSYYQSIEWMSNAGISTGTPQPTGKPLYKPTDPVSRQAMAAFLYRYSTN